MKYFVCSDIHGFFDEWMKALDEKGFDINNKDHQLIICGDLLDRGRQPKEVIDYVLKHKDDIIFIRGNHEDLMQELIDRNFSIRRDIHNGTAQTIVDIEDEWLISKFDLREISKDTGLKELLSLPINYYETEHYIFVHGWIPIYSNADLNNFNWRNATNQEWYEARWVNPIEMYQKKMFVPNKTIVCGHFHVSLFWHIFDPAKYDEFGDKANFDPFITKEVIGLDACTVLSGKVNVVVLED